MDIKRIEDELEFVIFSIENVAKAAGVSTQDLMDKITIQSDILNNYIVAKQEDNSSGMAINVRV